MKQGTVRGTDLNSSVTAAHQHGTYQVCCPRVSSAACL